MLRKHTPPSNQPIVDPLIFREYDIRGVVEDNLRVQDAYLIARAFATRAAGKEPVGFIAVGRDGRLSSQRLMDAVCQGVVDCGLCAVDIGLGPTPMLYYASHTMKTTAGIMVTGSHNPPDHNGFKMVMQDKPFFGEDIQSLYHIIDNADFRFGKGYRQRCDIRLSYLETLLKAYEGDAPLKVVWDAGNGAAGEIMTNLAARLPGKHVLLNHVIDGTFPAHHPDPTLPETLAQLIDTVKKRKFDLGIAFDGDGDRIGVVDDEGHILWGDQLMMLFSAEVLKQHPGATIIADIKASGALFNEISRLGGQPIMYKTGHSLIKAKMAQTGALLAGEMSGHLFFADRYFGFDDALYASVRLLSLLSRSGKKLSDLRKALPARINTPELRIPCDDRRKFSVIEEVKQRLIDTHAQFSDVDGVRVTTSDGWWLLRASNTQPVLVGRCEALDKEALHRLVDELQAQLKKSGVRIAF